jgi:hypothetical protein
MVNSGAKSAAQAARLFGFHRSTISWLLAVERLSAQIRDSPGHGKELAGEKCHPLIVALVATAKGKSELLQTTKVLIIAHERTAF